MRKILNKFYSQIYSLSQSQNGSHYTNTLKQSLLTQREAIRESFTHK